MASNAGKSLAISVKKLSNRKPVAVNDRSNQWSSFDDALAAALKLSTQNYFSRLRALHNFYPLDIARSTDVSFSYAPHGYGLLAPVRIDFSCFLVHEYIQVTWHYYCTSCMQFALFYLSSLHMSVCVCLHVEIVSYMFD